MSGGENDLIIKICSARTNNSILQKSFLNRIKIYIRFNNLNTFLFNEISMADIKKIIKVVTSVLNEDIKRNNIQYGDIFVVYILYIVDSKSQNKHKKIDFYCSVFVIFSFYHHLVPFNAKFNCL